MTAPLPASGHHTVASMLSYWSTATPNAPFLIFDGSDGPGGPDGTTELDYRAGWALAERGAAVLAGLGVTQGERFAVVMGNRAEFFACWFGAAHRGAVMVPINPQGAQEDLAYSFRHARCRAVVCGPQQYAVVREAWPHAHSAIVVCGGDFDARARAVAPTPDPATGPLDPLAVLYTSGTTSRPKGVTVTHANYLAAGQTLAGHLRMRPDDRWMIALPLFHANAQYYCVMSALVSGASAAVAARFSATGWPRQVQRCGATLASLFAAPVRMILASGGSPGDRDNRLRASLFAQNLTPGQLREFEERFGCPLVQLYGMTETIAPPLMNPLFGPRDNMTLGLPTETGRVRVVDGDGRDVAPGQTGELLVAGRPGVTLMAGYLDDPDATEAAMTGGWLCTGDVVMRRADGFLAFHDRAKDMIKRSGENVAAAEVERAISEHPAVFESAVVGVPDPVRDEAIMAFVVRHGPEGHALTADDVIAFCASRLARGKVPDRVEFVDELPRTSVGKIRKHVLRERASRPAGPAPPRPGR